MRKIVLMSLLMGFGLLSNCKSDDPNPSGPDEPNVPEGYYFGADLSYVNQILDYNGVFKDDGATKDPYQIFSDHGTNLARFRLWHTPSWTKTVYDPAIDHMYNDLTDVEEGIQSAKDAGMEVLLDFHYSDIWADPENQDVPEAWENITNIEVLKDSVYNYTLQTLSYLKGKGLMPELVQIGNETNCGMMFSDAPDAFPKLNVCDGNWANIGQVINVAIDAVREVEASTKIILHVAEPQHVDWWFGEITTRGGVSDFDMIGISYYPLWHDDVPLGNISNTISSLKSKYSKEVIILETAYPWTTEGDDSYNNLFGGQTPLSGFPFTEQGQYDLLVRIAQEVIDGGGIGVVYWEPAWISSNMKDLWGTGSSWENCAFFDFSGNPVPAMDWPSAQFK